MWHFSFYVQRITYDQLSIQNINVRFTFTPVLVIHRQRERFDEKLEFKVHLLDYTADDSWIEYTLSNLIDNLNQDSIPDFNSGCDYCKYQIKTTP